MDVRYAEFKKGEVSKTKGQIKKHYTQYTDIELDYLALLVRSIGNIKLSNHAKKKEITVKLNDIKKILKSSDIKKQIIEYNRTNNDKRVLIRSKEKYETKVNGNTVYCNICFVLSLVTKTIITVYYNDTKDNHNTINLNRYNKNLKIF